MKILVIDDDPLAAEMSSAILEGEGHTVAIAYEAMEAIRQLDEQGDFEFIISDMNMPMISGIDLFQELRQQGITLPFILLTGDDPAAFIDREPRLDGCLLKDFSLEETLPALMSQVLKRY
jgi:CheY-like chemotaxis protein